MNSPSRQGKKIAFAHKNTRVAAGGAFSASLSAT